MFINLMTIGCSIGLIGSTRVIIKTISHAKEEMRSQQIELKRLMRKQEQDRIESIETNIHNQIMKASGVENNLGKTPLFKEKREGIGGIKEYVYDLPLGMSDDDIRAVRRRIEVSEDIRITDIRVFPGSKEIIIYYI